MRGLHLHAQTAFSAHMPDSNASDAVFRPTIRLTGLRPPPQRLQFPCIHLGNAQISRASTRSASYATGIEGRVAFQAGRLLNQPIVASATPAVLETLACLLAGGELVACGEILARQ